MLVIVGDRFHESSTIGSKAFYPYAEISVPGGVYITFLFNGRRQKASCENLAATVTNGMLAVCPACRAKVTKCIDTLDPQNRTMLLSADPLDVPSARIPDGVMAYHAVDPAIALLVCQESERRISSRTKPGSIVCYPAKTTRPFLARPFTEIPNG